MKDLPTIDSYIANFPADVQELLQEMREAIHESAPRATEAINEEGVPAFIMNGELVSFAGNRHHIGFYPGAPAMRMFHRELKDCKQSKTAVQFRIDRGLPIETIKKMVEFCVKDTASKKRVK